MKRQDLSKCASCGKPRKGAMYLEDIGYVCEKCEEKIIEEEKK